MFEMINISYVDELELLINLKFNWILLFETRKVTVSLMLDIYKYAILYFDNTLKFLKAVI